MHEPYRSEMVLLLDCRPSVFHRVKVGRRIYGTILVSIAQSRWEIQTLLVRFRRPRRTLKFPLKKPEISCNGLSSRVAALHEDICWQDARDLSGRRIDKMELEDKEDTHWICIFIFLLTE